MGELNKLKFIFLDFLSFDSPQAKVLNLSFILIILRIIPTNLLSASPVKCIFKTNLLPLVFKGHCPVSGIFGGCNCPACGMTRGMSRLLRGDLIGAWNFNKIVFLVFLVMVVLIAINLLEVVKLYKKNKKIYTFDRED